MLLLDLFHSCLYRFLHQFFGLNRLCIPFSPEQVGQCQPQRLRQRLQQRDLGETQAPFPLGHGGVADVQLFGQLLLGQAFFFSRLGDQSAGLLQIHGLPSLLSV